MNDKRERSRLFHLAQQAKADHERWNDDTVVPTNIAFQGLYMSAAVGRLNDTIANLQTGDADLNQSSVKYEIMMATTVLFQGVLRLAGLQGLDLETTYAMLKAEQEQVEVLKRKGRQVRSNGNG